MLSYRGSMDILITSFRDFPWEFRTSLLVTACNIITHLTLQCSPPTHKYNYKDYSVTCCIIYLNILNIPQMWKDGIKSVQLFPGRLIEQTSQTHQLKQSNHSFTLHLYWILKSVRKTYLCRYMKSFSYLF